jgi:hypothetical protein
MRERPRISAPISRVLVHHRALLGREAAGLLQHAVGMPILPMSCIGAALRSSAA